VRNIAEGTLTCEILDGWRTDAGTFESLLRANTLVSQTGANKMPAASKTPAAAEALVLSHASH